MKPYQERVMAEKSDLDIRLAKLSAFLSSEKRDEIPAEEVGRLEAQAGAMRTYSDILAERIAHFTAN